jgi:hypothetical protein
VYFTAYPGEGSAVQLPRIRPKVLQMSGDASWIINGIKWSSWGGLTAHGSGVSAVETCNPTCAGGGIVTTSSGITLSRRRRVGGRLVYECIHVVSPGPRSIATEVANTKECLGTNGFSEPDLKRGGVAATASSPSYTQCSKRLGSPLYLLTVSARRRVSVSTACAAWSGLLKSGRPTKCVGPQFQPATYPVLVRHRFHGWGLSLVKASTGGYSVIRLSRGRQSFDGGGQDAPPYPC